MNAKEQKMKWILAIITAVVIAAVVIMVVFFSDNGKNNSDTPASDVKVTDKAEEKEPEADKTDKAAEEKKEEKTAKQETKAETETKAEADEEEKTFTPLFMYFVTESDPNYKEYMAAVEELKKEYEGKVVFDIIDIDKNPEAKDNFPAEGNTPLLIMNNTKNEISGFGFKCGDKKQLKQYIDAAF